MKNGRSGGLGEEIHSPIGYVSELNAGICEPLGLHAGAFRGLRKTNVPGPLSPSGRRCGGKLSGPVEITAPCASELPAVRGCAAPDAWRFSLLFSRCPVLIGRGLPEKFLRGRRLLHSYDGPRSVPMPKMGWSFCCDYAILPCFTEEKIVACMEMYVS